MSKTKKIAKAPSVATKAAKDGASAVITWGVIAVIAIFVVIPMLPSVGDAAVSSTLGAASDAGRRLGRLPVPGPAGGWNGPSPGDTTVTSAAAPPPKPQPYGAPNGPIKPLPSVTPAAPKPEIGPAPDEPVLSGPPPGGILGELPGVGPVINELGPALKALNP